MYFVLKNKKNKINKVLAASIRKLITARARKNERTARMVVNARKCSQRPFNPPKREVVNHNLFKLRQGDGSTSVSIGSRKLN